jgi:hypothetical protein
VPADRRITYKASRQAPADQESDRAGTTASNLPVGEALMVQRTSRAGLLVLLAWQYAPRTISAQVRGAQPKGVAMPTVIGHHDVKDTDHWLASPKREEVFGPLGVTNIRTFVNPQNRTQVAVLMDVADLDVVMAAMQNQALADAMEYDGVLPETLVLLVEA